MALKLHFEPDLDFQRDAIEAVCGLFKGQEISRTEFTVTPPSKAPIPTAFTRPKPLLRRAVSPSRTCRSATGATRR